jgi:hypothetical protein
MLADAPEHAMDRPTPRRPGVVIAMSAVCVLAACTGPARTRADYRLKARHSAQEAQSAVATSEMAARLVKDRGAFSAYIAVVLSNAEGDASSVEATFGSIQPPDRTSDRLRSELSPVLNDVVDTIAGLRIAARRHEWSSLLDRSRKLAELGRSLRRFEKLPA